MEALIIIVVGALFPLVLVNALRLLLPDECYIWLKSKYPMGVILLDLAVGLPIFCWLLLTGVMVFSSIGARLNAEDYLMMAAIAVIPACLLVLAKILLKIFWKPTPEMLAHNDCAVARELEQMRKKLAQRGSQPPEESEQEIRRYWQCPNCGSKNDESEKACLRCGRAAALWGDQPVFFNEVEE